MPYFDTLTPEFVVSGVFFGVFVAMSGFVCIFASHFEREGGVLVGFDKTRWLRCQDGTPNVFHWGGQKGHVSADVLLFFMMFCLAYHE